MGLYFQCRQAWAMVSTGETWVISLESECVNYWQVERARSHIAILSRRRQIYFKLPSLLSWSWSVCCPPDARSHSFAFNTRLLTLVGMDINFTSIILNVCATTGICHYRRAHILLGEKQVWSGSGYTFVSVYLQPKFFGEGRLLVDKFGTEYE